MKTDSTIEITSYDHLANGDIFAAYRRNGDFVLAMKVATRADKEDQPNHDVLIFSSEQPPVLVSDAYLDGSPLVAKKNNLAFMIDPQKPEDIIFDVKKDIRARSALGCAFLMGQDIYLAVEMRNDRGDGVFFVNVKTGEGWHDGMLGTATGHGSVQTNLRHQACAVWRWQIVETTGEKTPWIRYEVPKESSIKIA
jgi:hypothetical protein